MIPKLKSWFQRAEDTLNTHVVGLGAVIAIGGLLWRLYYASDFYLNPDEAMHYMVAMHPWYGLAGFYRTATRIVHPPLFIALLRVVLRFGHSERMLRLIPITAGAVFPWFVMLWVRRFGGNAAALSAQLLLTCSPTLIDLSTEVRAYTLAFMLLSISLLLLEMALDQASTPYMACFHVFLYLAILSEYCVAWFVAALGIYVLVRFWHTATPMSLRVTWILGQAGALGLYIFLYFSQVARWPRRGLLGMYDTWLRPSFPQPNERLLVFALKGTYRQFGYLFQMPSLARLGVIAFLLGLYFLWKGRPSAYAILICLPFVVACLAAILRLFPFGGTRHTAILSIAIAAGIGPAFAAMSQKRILPILLAAIPLVLVWNLWETDTYFQIPRYRRHVSAMYEATEFLRSTVPPGSVILADTGTDHILGYYLGCPDYDYYDSDETYRMRGCAGLRFIVAPSFQFEGSGDLNQSLVQAENKYRLVRSPWVVAGGSYINVATPASDALPFGKTIAVFQSSVQQASIQVQTDQASH